MNNEQFVFLQLLKVGLWGDKHLDSLLEMVNKADRSLKEGGFDWQKVIELANQQTSLGIITDGMTRLPHDLRPSKVLYFNAIAQTSDIEAQNKQMNGFAPVLMQKLREKGIASLLLKGQGVGLCYPNPLHRQSGDIDLLIFDENQFLKACKLMDKISSSSDWSERSAHAEFQAMGFVVELHGKYGFTICPKVKKNLRSWNDRMLEQMKLAHQEGRGGGYREQNGLLLPSAQFDAIFVFAHMVNHFMTGGVGLRQVSDWMMLLYAHREEIDHRELEEDLEFLGLTKFWRVFAWVAVGLLGFPADKMPLYDEVLARKEQRKVMRLMDSIFKTGNFGALQKEEQLSENAQVLVKKVHTAFGQLPVYWRAGKVFPWESLYCFCSYSKGVWDRL